MIIVKLIDFSCVICRVALMCVREVWSVRFLMINNSGEVWLIFFVLFCLVQKWMRAVVQCGVCDDVGDVQKIVVMWMKKQKRSDTHGCYYGNRFWQC